MKQNILRGSYHLIKTWEKGQIDEAVNMYLKRDRASYMPLQMKEALERGQRLHKEWQEEVEKNHAIPAVFGSRPLGHFLTEQRYEVQVTPWLNVRGVIDCVDFLTPKLVEPLDWKSGWTTAQEYADSRQIEIYAWLLIKQGYKVQSGRYYAHNSILGETTQAKIWITDQRLRDAIEWMVTFGSDMHHYFEENGIFDMEREAQGEDYSNVIF